MRIISTNTAIVSNRHPPFRSSRGIQGTGDLDAHFQLISSSADDATISQVLQAEILLRQFDVKSSDPDLATLLAFIRLAPSGEGLEVSFGVSRDQLVSLIKRNTFSAQR